MIKFDQIVKPAVNPSIFLLFMVFAFCGNTRLIAQETKSELPKQKQTTLALYVSSSEAYAKWKSSPENIKILDVRTLDEYIFIGHAPMAYNVPLAIQTDVWNAEKQSFDMKLRSDFVEQVKRIAEPEDTILVTCRSGGRSAMAVNQLSKSGFKYVYNITDGFEGDMVKDETSLYYGKRMKNGWKNSGLPWTYELNPAQIVIADNKD